MEHRIEQLTALLEISRQIGNVLDLQTLLTHIDQASRKVLNCERTAVFLYEKESDELYSAFATGTQSIRFSSKKGLAGEVFWTGQPINVVDAYSDPRFNPSIDLRTGLRTRNLLTVPMHGHNGEVVAVLQLVNKSGGNFTSEDESLALTLASLTGVVVQRQILLDAYAVKQKMDLEMSVAHEIQASLMPKADPLLEGFDIAGWNRPADETGGDIFDFIPLSNGRLGILLADASGHGIGPALVAVQCRAMIRALFTATEDLDAILAQANRILNEDLELGRFVTVFLGILDPQKATIAYVSGGHAPILFYEHGSDAGLTKTATTQPLGILNPLVGLPADPIALQTGDILILITDGFHEWENRKGEEFGTDRVFAVVRENQNRFASEIIQAIYDEVVRFGKGINQTDDLTVILVKKV